MPWTTSGPLEAGLASTPNTRTPPSVLANPETFLASASRSDAARSLFCEVSVRASLKSSVVDSTAFSATHLSTIDHPEAFSCAKSSRASIAA